jgi:hypothetical protein
VVRCSAKIGMRLSASALAAPIKLIRSVGEGRYGWGGPKGGKRHLRAVVKSQHAIGIYTNYGNLHSTVWR